MPLLRKKFFLFSIEESRIKESCIEELRDSSMENEKKIFLDNGIKESRSNVTPRCPNNHRGVASNRDSFMSLSRTKKILFHQGVARLLNGEWKKNFLNNGIKESRSNATPWCVNNHQGVASNRDSLMPLLRKIFFFVRASRSRASRSRATSRCATPRWKTNKKIFSKWYQGVAI